MNESQLRDLQEKAILPKTKLPRLPLIQLAHFGNNQYGLQLRGAIVFLSSDTLYAIALKKTRTVYRFGPRVRGFDRWAAQFPGYADRNVRLAHLYRLFVSHCHTL